MLSVSRQNTQMSMPQIFNSIKRLIRKSILLAKYLKLSKRIKLKVTAVENIWGWGRRDIKNLSKTSYVLQNSSDK